MNLQNRILKKGFFIALLLLASIANAQLVKVHGVVSDSVTGQPIPFVNVVFKGKNIGTTTDMNGRYMLQSEWGSSTVQFSSIGYFRKEVKLSDKNAQKINVKLAPSVQQLAAVEIKGKRHRYKNKENPAVILIRQVLAHRDENRATAFEYFEYDKYVKSQYDINNFSKDWFDSRSMKSFQIVKEYVDTSSLNGKPFIPVLIQEKASHVYLRDYGKDMMEIVTHNQVSGINNGDVTSGIDQFMSKIGSDVDVYETPIYLFDKSFPSPISSIGPNFYRYYITDSSMVDGHQIKKLAFMPRNKTLVAFTGHMWVGDSTWNYAVKSIELNMDKRANVNFLDDMRVTQEFEYDPVVGWHLVKDVMIVDFQPRGKSIGIYNTKTLSYRNFKVNIPQPDSLYSGLNTISYLSTKTPNEEVDWNTLRHDTLSEKEEGVYDLVDTVKNIREFKMINNGLYLLAEGYIPAGKIEIGPIGPIMSFNAVEGIRVRSGFRTSRKFSKKWRFTAWGAYGFDDKRFKHGEKLEYYFQKNPNRYMALEYSDNLIQPGLVISAIQPDHFMFSFTRTPQINRFYVRELKYTYQHEWIPGFMNTFSFSGRIIEANKFNTFHHAVTDNVVYQINDNAVSIGARISFNERYIQGVFKRQYIKTQAPIFKVNYTYSGAIFGSDYTYQKLNLGIEKRVMLGIFGYTDLVLNAEKIWGRVPYPLLTIHTGNESIMNNARAYNLMNFMEFASDQSAGLFVEHHFNGLIMGMLPLVNHLKMRVVVVGKFLYGSIEPQNSNVNDPSLILPPARLGSLDKKPYIEASAGLENIFSIVRVDLVKRFTYLDADNIGNFFGVKGLAPRIAFVFKF